MFSAAGHRFEHTPKGIRCTAFADNGTVCGAAWTHVRTATPADVGCRGFAHNGNLTEGELHQIVSQKVMEEEAIWEAVKGGAEGTPW